MEKIAAHKLSLLSFGFLLLFIFSFKSEAKDIISLPTSGYSSFYKKKPSSPRAGVSSYLFKNKTNISSNQNENVVSYNIPDSIPQGGEEYGFKHLGMAVEGGNVNVREKPDKSSKRVGKFPDGCACEIVNEVGDWYQIVSGEVSGYVNKEFLLTGKEAEERAKEFLVSNKQLETSLNQTEAYYGRGVSDVRSSVVANAMQYQGLRYIWGGTSLTKGADCSGFVMRIMAQYGVYLPHSSAAQSNIGKKVSVNELQPGDLVFYGRRRVSHVAIYIGNGMVISELNKKAGCKVTGLNYCGRFIKATRVLP